MVQNDIALEGFLVGWNGSDLGHTAIYPGGFNVLLKSPAMLYQSLGFHYLNGGFPT
jgi:hypothetical protein